MSRFSIVSRIISSYMLNYPLLKEWGILSGRPLALIVDNFLQADNLITSFNPYSIILNKVKKGDWDTIEYEDTLPVILKIRRNKKCSLKQLKDMEELISYTDRTAILFVFERSVPTEMAGRMIEISLIGERTEGEIECFPDFNPNEMIQRFHSIREIARELSKNDPDKIELYASCSFYIDLIEQREFEVLVQGISEITVQSVVDKSSEKYIDDEIVCTLNKAIMELIEKKDIELLSQPEGINLQDKMFVSDDQSQLYINEADWKMLVSNHQSLQIEGIESILSKRGLLKIVDEKNGYSQKTVLYNQYGACYELNLLVFFTDRIVLECNDMQVSLREFLA